MNIEAKEKFKIAKVIEQIYGLAEKQFIGNVSFLEN